MESSAVDDELVSAVQQNQGSSGCDMGSDEPATNDASITGEDEVHGEASVVIHGVNDVSWEGVDAPGGAEGR
jgi:hypothetical protein